MAGNPKNQGFSLIEFVLYIALASIILTALFSLSSTITNLRLKNQSLAEVEQQGQQVLNMITQTVRNASLIISPAPGNSAASLSLNTYSSGTSPTVFSLSNGTAFVQEGTAPAVSLTSARVTVTNFNIQNLAASGTNDLIRVSFTISTTNPSGKVQYSFSKNFYSSAAVRGTYP